MSDAAMTMYAKTADAGPVALAIAGFDPSSGAGITADLMTFAAHGVFGTSAITALTVQSTLRVFAVETVAPAVLRDTLQRLEDDLPPAGIKLGMLGSEAHVEVVARYLAQVRAERTVTVVLDPVLRSSSGTALLRADGAAAALRGLLPLVDVVTPNLNEAAALTGMPCTSAEQMEECARQMCTDFERLRVVVTGGHLAQPSDLLCGGGDLEWFTGRHIATPSTHGTGCAFSSALLARRLLGATWPAAVRAAKDFVTLAMERAIPRGGGRGPMALLPQLQREAQTLGLSGCARDGQSDG